MESFLTPIPFRAKIAIILVMIVAMNMIIILATNPNIMVMFKLFVVAVITNERSVDEFQHENSVDGQDLARHDGL